MSYQGLSFWFDSLPESERTPRPSLSTDITCDVAIIGAGFTGLWTAYYLTELHPELDIAVIEQEIAGFGASGRNGGWASALFPRSASSLEITHGTEQAVRLRQAMIDTVKEIGRVVDAESINCDFLQGGTLEFARGDVQWAAAQEEIAQAQRYGVDALSLRSLDAYPYGIDGLKGTVFDPNCARIQPAKLVRALAHIVESRGVSIYERSGVTSWQPHSITANGHTVSSSYIVLAVEGYRAILDKLYGAPTRPTNLPPRSTLPLYSSMIATAPLTDQQWSAIGVEQGQTFSDFRHLLIYGQRTADNRIAFGGRGAHYHWRSAIKPGFDKNGAIFRHLEHTLHELMPSLPNDLPITHRWGGPLGVPRDWHASVGLDPETGIAWCGGYVGDGVSTTNLGGRTLAALITESDDPITTLPWVNHEIRPWEPEPLRFIGTNLGLSAMTAADVEERLSRRPSFIAKVMGPLIGS